MMNSEYSKIKNLFLQQSYYDAWEEYSRQLIKNNIIVWDYVVLTASNQEQADTYQHEIDYRLKYSYLPKRTKYVVISDPKGLRVGSGGATLNVLKEIYGHESANANCFENKRILVIHSGGDSKRVPQYSACGKLFAPVPRELPTGRLATLFDEFMIATSMIPSRIAAGMLVLSGDVLLLFNALQIDPYNEGATAISFKQPASIGKNHGVFLNSGHDFVDRFLHKQSEDELDRLGAINKNGNVDLDTGAVILSPKILTALFQLISDENGFSEEKFDYYVNSKARLSFYGDFLYPLAEKSTIEDYLEQAPEGDMCEELIECRKKLWDALHEFRFKLLCLSPAEFIHFGTTKELLQLMTEKVLNYEFLGWRKHVLCNVSSSTDFAVNNCIIDESAVISNNVYIENSFIGEKVNIRKNSVISCVNVSDIDIPENVVIHGLQLKSNKYVARIYGIYDNPKKTLSEKGCIFGVSLKDFIEHNKIKQVELWESADTSLWKANLYSICDSIDDAVHMSMIVYKMAHGTASQIEVKQWISSERMSLYSSFTCANGAAIIPMKTNLEDKILVNKFIHLLNQGEEVEESAKIFYSGLNESQYQYLQEYLESAVFSEKIRIYYALSKMIDTKQGEYETMNAEEYERLTFESIKQTILNEVTKRVKQVKNYKIKKNEVNVALPVRLNWGGGWTDTPPYCIEQGGVVLNAAIKLEGELPVRVCVRRIEDLCIELESTDIGAHNVFSEIEEMQQCNNPYDPFSLHKAALIACGIIPRNETADLKDILRELGGGIYLSTQVINVPKGSGLGTSSILAGACVKGLFEFLDVHVDDSDLYDIVLCMEQLMSTGGGWQDQVGGLASGIKFITTKPGVDQHICVEKVNLSNSTIDELNQRLTLIYTGQRRLARNLLRDVVGRYVGGKVETVSALHDMSRLAALMKFELEQGDIDAFASLLNDHWKLSVQMDEGSTNTCIEQIFMSCEDLIDGRFIAGAGGGGFLQVILKKNVTKEMLRQRLYSIFQDSGVDVWDCEII